MDTLPLELKEKIVGYLKKSDVQRLSAVSKEWNRLLEDIVWRKPKFTTKVSLSELVQYNRPIKILHSRSLSDFDNGLCAVGAMFLSSITTLKRLVLNHKEALRISEIDFLRSLECEIWIKSDLLHDTLLSTTEDTDNLLQGLKKLDPKIDFHRNYNEYWSLDTLSQLEGLDILYLETTSICLFNISTILFGPRGTSAEIANVIKKLNPREINLGRESCCDIAFSPDDIKLMNQCHITAITTSLLRGVGLHPWPELKEIEDLELIVLKSGTRITLENLKMFDIKAVLVETDYWNPYEFLVMKGEIEVIAKFLEQRLIWTRLYNTYETVYYVEEESVIQMNKTPSNFEFRFCTVPITHIPETS